jgi:diguanylate cyclase (GGDEF)-like protein/PAS domain S-box-containing protein
MNDITDRNESERRLALSEQRLRAIAENLPTLIGHVDKNEKFLFLNNKAARFYGKDADQLLGRPVREAYAEMEYRYVKPYIDSALAGHKVTFENEIAINGKKHHYHAIYVPDIDRSGAVNGFYAMAFDITDRKNSELRQSESEERLRTITDSLPVLISYIDHGERYRFSNATYQDWFGISPSEMIGKTVLEIVGPENYEPRKDYLRRGLSGERIRFETEGKVKGETRNVETIYIPHVRGDVVEGIYTLSTDITSLKIVEKQLSLLARLDTLTALPNRRSFDEKLNEAAMRSRRTGQPIALMFLDIDHFKSINDTLGHAGGDDVLKEFANRVKASVRATDTLSRLAGDEFTIILEGIRIPDEAALVANKILASVETPISAQGKPLSVTTSIGIAFLRPDDSDISRLLIKADEALYKAKAAGRNQLYINDDTTTSARRSA